MAKLSYKLSYYVLYALFAAIIVVLGLFFFGGDAQGDAVMMGVDPEMWQPAYTDALLYLNYAFFAIVSVSAVISFFHFLVSNPKASMGSLYVLAGSIIVLAITWFMGSPEKLEIISYDGSDNVGFWAQATDMFLYSLYTLFVVAIVCMMLGAIKKKLS
ncbi:hypothetical protein [uncultured Bacteroides sp.]|uniref:hypothetical protein n=1 Tax=uncultured Bacteroides sp. TaxID=162156 RepID=UPI00262C2FDF|nr:hypothetical protein [uncultured Bacteroides sp.]